MYIKDDPYASYKLLRTEFLKKGYTIDEEVINDHRFVTYKSLQGGAWRTAAALLKYPCIADDVHRISRHKELAYAYAERRGVKIPGTHTLQKNETLDAATAEQLLARYETVIVKPSDASLSRGLTVNIRLQGELTRAIAHARAIADTILIQEQVEGEEVRFTVIDGKVVAALLRQTPRVTGDGISTVSQLIAAENAARKTLIFPYISYPQLDDTIIPATYLASDRVLADGEVLELNRATMIKNGCSIYDVVDQVHESYKATVEQLVSDLDARFLVVDIFMKDFRTPQTEDNYWFIEFNTSPVLKLYYACRDGKMFDIAPRLASSIDAGLQNS
jgi:D-alanine-D-alanine ligase-like ATP-grasp enzyme